MELLMIFPPKKLYPLVLWLIHNIIECVEYICLTHSNLHILYHTYSKQPQAKIPTIKVATKSFILSNNDYTNCSYVSTEEG